MPILSDLVYHADCSVTPLTAWQHHPGASGRGPDFTDAPAGPYFLDTADLTRPGQSPLLEVPVTILFTDLLGRIPSGDALLRSLERRSILRGAARRLRLARSPQWYRPWPQQAAKDLNRVYRAARRAGLPLVEMMFHSSELLPGGSPFHPTEASVEKLYDTLNDVFAYAARDGAAGMTLGEFADNFVGRTRPVLATARLLVTRRRAA